MFSNTKSLIPTSVIVRSMKAAARAGFNPYSNADVMADKYRKAWADKARRMNCRNESLPFVCA